MENQNDTPEYPNTQSFNDIDEQYIISIEKFFILSIATLGIYGIWWMYKAWRFYKQKEKSDIMPAARAIFCIIFMYPLCEKILSSAVEKGYTKSYSSVFLFIGFFLVSFLGKLPEPISLLSIFSFVFLIPPFNAFNYARRNSPELVVNEQTSFNDREVGLILVGAILWFLVLFGLNSGFNLSMRTD